MPPPLVSPSPSPLRDHSESCSERELEDHEDDSWDAEDYQQHSGQDVKPENVKYEDMKQDLEGPGALRALPVYDQLKSVEIPESTLTTPRSMYRTYDPVTELCKFSLSVSEVKALAALDRPAAKDEANQGDDEYYLDDFAVYSNHRRYTGDLTSLHELFRSGKKVLFFDGTLSKGRSREKKYRLQQVDFGELSIGNYGVEHHTVGDSIWIRSVLNRKKGDLGIWYKLGAPGIEYIRFFEPFRWLADLAKHLVDYIEARKHQAKVGIYSFRNHFATWLLRVHGNAGEFQSWFCKHPSYDYRSAVSAYADFLQHQVHGTLPGGGHDIKLFKEVLHLTQYPGHSRPENDTIVTPYVFSLFSHMDCRAFLKATVPKNAPTPATRPRRNSEPRPCCDAPTEAMLASIKPGDVISTTPDDSKSGTKWLQNHASWYARVQDVSVTKRGKRLFHVAWLYHPSDTPCGTQLYPWDNELFFSNHCSCHSSVDHAILAEEVLGKHSVEWFGNENTKAEFFVRQIYLTEERRWVALRESDLVCGQDQDGKKYRVGDTILAQMFLNATTLEPCEIIDFSGNKARLRQLKRRHTMINGSSGDAPPNELVYTDNVISIPISWIQGPCTIRVIPAGTAPPTPYDRRGTGNCFYITHRLQGDSTLVPITDADTSIPSCFRQGFNPGDKSCTPLRGLDLFAGCGNLGRGIQESGAVKVKWVNDIWDTAVHTYMANADPKTVVPFLGSVDVMLEKALKGECGPSVPAKGEVEFISGGSPCQGFSLLTANKSSDQQKKNRSLVASFASFVDFYRPKYGILENVTAIIGGSPQGGNDYFRQLLCAIVGMGYQTQIIMGDAWTYGAPQSRSRTFLLFALPDYTLPARPMMSHSHPQEIRSLGLGKMSNGERFADRELDIPTAFRYVTSGEAMRGLPNIQDGRVRICPGFPDHRSNPITPTEQLRTTLIPTAPYGMGFAKAYESGQITEAERLCFPAESYRVNPKSRGWTRLDPTRLFSTVTTTPQPTDARTARITHPSEHRTLSILEIRRAQGMPDDEVLVGSVADRWKLVGNSVARQAALALGLELRRAMCGSLYETRDDASASVDTGVAKAAAAPPEVEVIETVVETTTTTTMATEIEVRSWPVVTHKPAIPDGPKQPSARDPAMPPPPPPPQRPAVVTGIDDGDRGDRPTATVQLSAKTTVFKSSTVTSRYGGVAAGVKRRRSCGNQVWEESTVKRHRRSSMEDAIACR